MHIIEYKGNLYAFETKESECESDAFISRCWFIVKNIAKFEDYEYLLSLSHVWVNCKYLNVLYDDCVMKELEQCESP